MEAFPYILKDLLACNCTDISLTAGCARRAALHVGAARRSGLGAPAAPRNVE